MLPQFETPHQPLPAKPHILLIPALPSIVRLTCVQLPPHHLGHSTNMFCLQLHFTHTTIPAPNYHTHNTHIHMYLGIPSCTSYVHTLQQRPVSLLLRYFTHQWISTTNPSHTSTIPDRPHTHFFPHMHTHTPCMCYRTCLI